MTLHEEPVGGRLLTKPVIALSAIFAAGMLVVLYRFYAGIGAVTALNDGYAWGAWKPLSIIVFTAFASGGYAIALLVYVLDRRKYHSLARVAILTSALGYTTGVIALGIDIGRPWNFWRILILSGWNLRSVLLEVAVCISTYIIFLWLEVAPSFLDDWRTRPSGDLKKFAVRVTPLLEAALPWIIAMGIVLPSMHQSSLGSLFLLAGPRLHPYWQTPLVPLLFLLSCWLLGYAFVAITSMLSSLVWKRPLLIDQIASLSRVTAWVIFVFAAIRVGDLVGRGQWVLVPFSGFSVLVLLELALLVGPAVVMSRADTPTPPSTLFLASGAVLAGGGLYRLDTALIGFMPGPQWSYFPSVAEMLVTVAFVALAVVGYIVIVKRFPILPAAHARAAAAA